MTISENIAQRVEEFDAPQQKALLTFLETMEKSGKAKRPIRKKRRSRKAEISAALRGIAGMWKDRTDLPKDPVEAVKVLRGRMIILSAILLFVSLVSGTLWTSISFGQAGPVSELPADREKAVQAQIDECQREFIQSLARIGAPNITTEASQIDYYAERKDADSIIKLLDNKQEMVCGAAVAKLMPFASQPHVRDALINTIQNNPYASARFLAIQTLTLAKVEDNDIRAKLFSAFGDRNFLVRACVIQFCSNEDRRCIPFLRGALNDKSYFVRAYAVSKLGQLKARESVGDLLALIGDDVDLSEHLRGDAKQLLDGVTDPVTQAILIFNFEMQVIGYEKIVWSRPDLLNHSISQNVVIALGNIGDEKAVEDIAKMLGKYSDPADKANSLAALGSIGGAKAKSIILSYSNDTNAIIRDGSKRALDHLSQKENKSFDDKK